MEEEIKKIVNDLVGAGLPENLKGLVVLAMQTAFAGGRVSGFKEARETLKNLNL